MEQYNREINLKNIEGDFMYFNIFLYQKIDDIGVYSNVPVLGSPVYKDLSFKERFSRPDNASIESWFQTTTNQITGTTDSRLEELKTYDFTTPYLVNFDIESINYIDYIGNTINGVSRVTKYDNDEKIYVFDANNDSNIGTNNQITGLRYIDDINGTHFIFNNQSYNETNSILSAMVKEDHLMGVSEILETKSDIFIDRGSISVMEKILQMSEINNLNQLMSYANGSLNVVNNQ